MSSNTPVVVAPGKVLIHLLHIRKTGGTVLKHALDASARMDRCEILQHGHGTLLRHVPQGEQVIFFLRDPLTRFVSGFYCRQRQGLPRYNSPWKPDERAAFEQFSSPNELARTLCSSDRARRQLAWTAMGSIQHLCSTLTWLEGEAYLRSRLPDLFYIGFQETLNRDFESLKHKLGLPEDLRLSDDEVAAHRAPAHFSYHLDDVAKANLREWYDADQRMVDFCRTHAAQINGRPFPGEKASAVYPPP
jgi:Sulfotransferase family